ncbi:TadE family protein [Virgibacillus soli]|uniref:Pilus assembly protein n=1 Tax=Paracerasibacillus soli TaxID=480284 RepID=A0ABU5CSX3_9BACI|nr:TadE family protein [Virgibacillus soli]MDY0408520.1 pilus assembly protein [Virgibacillus soli]
MISLLRRENGSITIEAALLIPIILTFILFLTSLVKISIAEMALQDAVSDTAQTVAHYTFLSLVAEKKIQETTDGFIDDLKDKAGDSLGNHDIANNLLEKLAQMGKDLVPTSGQVIDKYGAKPLYEKAVKDKYREIVKGGDFFNPDGIKIFKHEYPNTRNDAKAIVGAEVELKIVVPFFEKKVKVKKLATERAWAGK